MDTIKKMNSHLKEELIENIKTNLNTRIGKREITNLMRSKAELYLADNLTHYLDMNNVNEHQYIREFKPFYSSLQGSIDLAIFENDNVDKQQFPDLSVEFKHYSNGQTAKGNVDFLKDINKRHDDLNMDVMSVFFYTCIDDIVLDKSDTSGQLDFNNITLLNYYSKSVERISGVYVKRIIKKNKEQFFDMYSEQVEKNYDLNSIILVTPSISSSLYLKDGRLDLTSKIYCCIFYKI